MSAPETLLVSHPQDNQAKYRVFGSSRRGTIVDPDLVASNGIIHIINKLMDTVAPTVKSQREVSTPSRQGTTLSDGWHRGEHPIQTGHHTLRWVAQR